MTRELMQEFLIRLFEEHRITTVFVTSEIEEAIFLADQVIVLSNGPAVVKEVIEIDIPRPRDLKVLSSRSFGAIHGRILNLLLDEAKKSFSEDAMQTVQSVESYGRATRGDISVKTD
jgi:NitT/TauT family transport system ATP-binding protein